MPPRTALGVFGDPVQPGWAVAGDLAAIAYDAPLAVGSGIPPDFYVPNRLIATNAVRTYRTASDPLTAACTVAVAPTLLVSALPLCGNAGLRGGARGPSSSSPTRSSSRWISRPTRPAAWKSSPGLEPKASPVSGDAPVVTLVGGMRRAASLRGA